MQQKQPIILEWLFSKAKAGEFEDITSLSHWKIIMTEQSPEWKSTVDRAIGIGFMADRVAYAFLAGFRSAMQYLLPELEPFNFASFCITEKDGNHPRAIKTSLKPRPAGNKNSDGWLLNGHKTFITGASEADLIFVAATQGEDDSGKSRIKLVRLDHNQPGISIKEMKALPFIPEIAHGNVSFNNVKVTNAQILPGDGYDCYIKPFRIIEEIHVMAALLGYLLRMSFEYQWGRVVVEKISALILLARGVAELDLKASATHIAFAGFLDLLDQLINEIEPCWNKSPDSVSIAWKRDKAILAIAQQARSKRLERAWESFKSIK